MNAREASAKLRRAHAILRQRRRNTQDPELARQLDEQIAHIRAAQIIVIKAVLAVYEASRDANQIIRGDRNYIQ
jgi:hypothetical protein